MKTLLKGAGAGFLAGLVLLSVMEGLGLPYKAPETLFLCAGWCAAGCYFYKLLRLLLA